jgi:hypothetical protein
LAATGSESVSVSSGLELSNGNGKAKKFAEICAAVVLPGETSLLLNRSVLSSPLELPRQWESE